MNNSWVGNNSKSEIEFLRVLQNNCSKDYESSIRDWAPRNILSVVFLSQGIHPPVVTSLDYKSIGTKKCSLESERLTADPTLLGFYLWMDPSYRACLELSFSLSHLACTNRGSSKNCSRKCCRCQETFMIHPALFLESWKISLAQELDRRKSWLEISLISAFPSIEVY